MSTTGGQSGPGPGGTDDTASIVEGSSLRRQGIFWILTIPEDAFTPPSDASGLAKDVSFIKGQLELGGGGFRHWQLVVAFAKKSSLVRVRAIFGPFHAELTRSTAALEYVWKDDTSLGSRFSVGVCPVARNVKVDWEHVWESAKGGDFMAIPAGIRVHSYRNLKSIACDYQTCPAINREVYVFVGPTGTGKSREAWDSAGMEAYAKDPRTKFWCGYRGQKCVIIDEFRGGIDVSHMLRWLDRYPVSVETKGSATALLAEKVWITSNLLPRLWYPDLDEATFLALERRLIIKEFV